MLVLLGDVLSSAYQQAQLNQGIYSPETVSVGDLFVGAIIPGLILVASYLLYVLFKSFLKQFYEVRIKENANVFDFNLNNEQMKILDGLEEGLRFCPDPAVTQI